MANILRRTSQRTADRFSHRRIASVFYSHQPAIQGCVITQASTPGDLQRFPPILSSTEDQFSSIHTQLPRRPNRFQEQSAQSSSSILGSGSITPHSFQAPLLTYASPTNIPTVTLSSRSCTYGSDFLYTSNCLVYILGTTISLITPLYIFTIVSTHMIIFSLF